ncbi:uncharacterized protein BDV14DRAFT_198814 [Aspergillus stella-maris]|uniref:uncharacterized protein n=1 Tax=Aspergillus stella-maris TaxID=1810926 RepID=UPI003CCCFB97
MSAPPFNPIIANGGFELGVLAPWTPSDPAAAIIGNGTQAFEGDYFLKLESAPGNRANMVSQRLHDLETSATYTVSAEVLGPEAATTDYCYVTIYVGHNSTTGLIANANLYYDYDEGPQWVELTGTFTAKKETVDLHLSTGCVLAGASHTKQVVWDAVKIEESAGLAS